MNHPQMLLVLKSSRKKTKPGKPLFGVVKNCNHRDLTRAISPIALMYNPGQFSALQVRLSGSYENAAEAVEKAWATVHPGFKVDQKEVASESKQFYEIVFGDLVKVLGVIVFMLCGCTHNYYTADDFSSVKKIDTHVHLNAENTSLADLAREDNFLLVDVSVDVPSYPSVEEQQRLSLYQIEQNPDVVKFITAFTLENFDSSKWADETINTLKKSFETGALGIKLWKNIGMTYRNADSTFIMVDDPRLDPVINFVIQQDKTVMAHIGEPKNCWLPLEEMTVNNDRNYFKNHPQYHMYLHPEYPSYEDQINARDRFLERHPDMRFVGAHLGSLEWDVDELAKRLDKFPNMAVDMAARIPHLQYQTIQDREKVRNFFIRYQDRLIYATDSDIDPDTDFVEVKKYVHEKWLADWKYFVTDDSMTATEVNGTFKGLKLPKEVIDKIFRENAIKWFKL